MRKTVICYVITHLTNFPWVNEKWHRTLRVGGRKKTALSWHYKTTNLQRCPLCIFYGFQFCGFNGLPLCVYVCVSFLYVFLVLFFCLLCPIPLCLFCFTLFYYHYSLDTCLFSRDRQKSCGCRREYRKGNPNQKYIEWKQMKKRWRRRNKWLKRRKGNIRNFHKVLHVHLNTQKKISNDMKNSKLIWAGSDRVEWFRKTLML